MNPDSILQNINENRYLRSVRRKSAETYYPQAVSCISETKQDKKKIFKIFFATHEYLNCWDNKNF